MTVGSRPRATLLGLLALLLASGLHAHEMKPRGREIVRLQGHVAPEGSEQPAADTVTISILGQRHQLRAASWRLFRLAGDADDDESGRPATVTLHGDRATLRRLAAARADQVVTILAERRSGATDLFLLTLDFCPGD